MASLSKDAKGNVTIQFVGGDRHRRSIRLGKINAKTANEVKLKVEHLNALLATKLPMDADTARWVANIGDALAAKLATVGLVPERPKAVTLAGLLALYATEREAGNKPGTKTNHRTISNDLTRFFAPNADAKALTEGDARRFLEHLRKRELASYTIARRIRRVRSIFAFAVKAKIVPADPFAELKVTASLPEDRKAYLPVADAERLLAAANPTRRTITALARFAGLRCPSEVFRLRWEDVDFATGRMTIPNVKTAGQTGKEYRVCPIFGALRPHLEDAHELAGPGTVHVVSGPLGDRIREKMDGPNGSNDANVGTTFRKLIKRAGLTPWPRLFNTLRASCETDLLAGGLSITAVTNWLGHSAAIAVKHYDRIPDDQWTRATGAGAVQKPVQSGADTSGRQKTQPTEPLEIQRFRRLVSCPDVYSPDSQMTLRGFEPRSIP